MATYREGFLKRKPRPSKQDVLFLAWVDEVELMVQKELGIGLVELTDMPYYVSFENGVTAARMAKRVIASALDY